MRPVFAEKADKSYAEHGSFVGRLAKREYQSSGLSVPTEPTPILQPSIGTTGSNEFKEIPMLTAGVARTCLTPFWGVELTGWGYYIERKWQRIHDDLHATALVVDDGQRQVALVTLDLMVIDERFARMTRERIQQETDLAADAILLTCSHSHNAPAAGGLLGVGQCDPAYEDWASRQAATAVVMAWRNRRPARLATGRDQMAGHTFNRTRSNGLVDANVTVLRVDSIDDRPLAVVVNFGAHPTVSTQWRPYDVSRDLPGDVCDRIERAIPNVMALYVQGACGDVNFLPEYVNEVRHHEPAHRLAETALSCAASARPSQSMTVNSASEIANLPTRRWLREEIDHDRDEAQRRLASDDVTGWRDTIGRSMTNRPDDMVTRHGGNERKAVRAMARFHIEWTDRILLDWDTRPETLQTEVQALRIGDLTIVANSSEFFTSFALDVRQRANVPEIMLACYSNGRIGYLPDDHDIKARSYAGFQSPKYCNQFPFTANSGPAMCDAMLRTIARSR